MNMDLNQTVYVPYVGEKKDDLNPYWVGTKNNMTEAWCECERVKNMLLESHNQETHWDVMVHTAGEIPNGIFDDDQACRCDDTTCTACIE